MNQLRAAKEERTTLETKVAVTINLAGQNNIELDTGLGFFDHMLHLFAYHGCFDLTVQCQGDIQVDGHHSLEDIGIVMGKAFKKALGDKKAIKRYGSQLLPMDESLILVSLDISGRPYLYLENPPWTEKVGTFDTELVEEFLRSFANHLGLTLHVKVLYGKNTHHMIEGIFKALGRALREAIAIDLRFADSSLPSSKGLLD